VAGSGWSGEQVRTCFEQARAGKSFEECVRDIDLSKVDLAEETPALLKALNGSDAVLARRAAWSVNDALRRKDEARRASVSACH
jgi:hypothetical protein